MNQLERDTEAMKKLLRSKRTPQHTRLVEDGLNSKWEGVQSVAVRVLGHWGDEQSKVRLRKFLGECISRKNGWSIRHVVIQQLVKTVTRKDSEWILEYFFAPYARSLRMKWEFLPLVTALPQNQIQQRLIDESHSSSEVNRQAAMMALRRIEIVNN